MFRRREERGAAAVITGVCFLVILTVVAAFAVDLGMQRVVRRDMQSLADVVALDVGRQLNGQPASTLLASSEFQTAFRESVARNYGSTLGENPTVRVEVGKFDGQKWAATYGYLEMVAGSPPPTLASHNATSDTPNAVRVSSKGSVGFAFVGGKGAAERAAVATQSVPAVCFSVGTKALTLNTSQSALSPLLDHILRVNLGAVGYEGLVDLKQVYVPLADVLVELNVGSVDQLLSTNVSLADFMVAVAKAIRANGDTANAALLEAVKLGVAGSQIALSKILALSTGTDVAGLTSSVNVLDLVGAAIVAANGQNAVNLDVTGLASLKVIEPPQIACGGRGTLAKSAQIDLHLKPNLGALSALGLLNGKTDLVVRVASGSATIDADLSCAPESVTLKVTTGTVEILPPQSPPTPPPYGQVNVRVTLDKFLSFLGPLNVVTKTLLKLLGLDEVGLDVLVTGSVATTTETKVVDFPEAPQMPPPIVIPSSGMGSALTISGVGVQLSKDQDSGLIDILKPLLNGALSAVLSGLVRPIVNDVVSPAVTAILNPLFGLLGIKLGVADVNMLGRPVCSGVRLVA